MTITRKYHRMNIRFVLRKTRTNGKGECPVCFRLTKNRLQTSDYNTGVMVKPERWNHKAQRVRGSSKDVEDSNQILKNLYDELDGIYKEYLIMGTELTPKEVVNIYRGGDTVPELAKRYLNLLEDKDRAEGTIKRYRRSFDLLAEFVGGQTSIRRITKKQAHEFWPWLHGPKGFTQNYCNKVLQACRGLLDYAIRIDQLVKNPFAHIRLEWDGEMDITCLSKQELHRLHALEWNDRLQQVVDAFLVMCYSGMHIGDYLAFRTEDIVEITYADEEGEVVEQRMIRRKREKTNVTAMVPLHEEVERLIEKYGSVEDLPRISTQKMNDYLKLVQERIGTSKNLTNKIARKTFTDICINQFGMSYEAVAGALGHTSTRQVKHYGAIRERRILDEWNKGRSKA